MTASGHTVTAGGDLAERIAAEHFGFTTALEGKRQGPFDLWYGDVAVELKARFVQGREYKTGMGRDELVKKQAAADRMGVQAAIAMMVVDADRGTAHLYWMEGIRNSSLVTPTGKVRQRDWKFMGSVTL